MPIATIDDAREFIRDYVNRRNVSAEQKLDIFIQEAYDELTQLDFAFWSQSVEVEIPKEAWESYCEDGRIPIWLIEALISAKTGKNYRIKKINDVWYKDEEIVSQIIKNQQGTQYYRVKIVNRSNQDGYFILPWKYLFRIYHRRYDRVYFYDPQLDILYRPHTTRLPFYLFYLKSGEEKELWVFEDIWWKLGMQRWGKYPNVKKIVSVFDDGRIQEEDFSPPVSLLDNLRLPNFASPIRYREYHFDRKYKFSKSKAIIFYHTEHYAEVSSARKWALKFHNEQREFLLFFRGWGNDYYLREGDSRWFIGAPHSDNYNAEFEQESVHYLLFYPEEQKIRVWIEWDDRRTGRDTAYFFGIIRPLVYSPDEEFFSHFFLHRQDLGRVNFTTRTWYEIDDILDEVKVDVYFWRNGWRLWNTFDWTQGNVPTAYTFPSVQEIQKENWRKLEYKKVSENLRRRGGDFPVVWALEETTVKYPSLFLGYLAENVVGNTIYDMGKAIELSPIPNVKNAVKLKIKGKIVPRFWQDEPRIWQDLIEILAEMTYVKVLRYLDEDELANQKYAVLVQRLAGYVIDSQSISTPSFQPLRFSDYTLAEEEMFKF
jgi:hypothetical protein